MRIKAKRPTGGRALGLAAILAVGGMPLAVLAQDQDAPRFTYGIDSRIAAHDNVDLVTSNPKSSVLSDTRLSFGYRTGTPLTWLGLDGSILLRQKIAGDATVKNGLINPNLRFSFGHQMPGGGLDGALFLRETDLTGNNDLDSFDGNSGTRRDRGGNLRFRWGEDSRAAFRIGVDTIYSDFSGTTANVNRHSLTYSAGTTLGLSDVLTLDVDLSQQHFQQDGSASRITNGLNAGLNLQRPDGVASVDLSLSDTPEGTRTGLTLGRSFELPDGSLSARIGVVHGVSGRTRLSGGIDYARDLPRGRLSASLNRDTTSSSDTDSEVEITRATIGLTQDLSPRSMIGLDLGLSNRSYTSGSSPDVRNTHAGVNYSYDLTENWSGTAGVQHEIRKDGGGTATDNSVYIGLRSSFSLK